MDPEIKQACTALETTTTTKKINKFSVTQRNTGKKQNSWAKLFFFGKKAQLTVTQARVVSALGQKSFSLLSLTREVTAPHPMGGSATLPPDLA